MKNATLLLLILIFNGCANLKHATSFNLQDFQSFSSSREQQDFYNNKVKELTKEELKDCNFLSDIQAKDNAYDQGKEYAILYLKYEAYKLKANAIYVKEVKTIGDYGHQAFGKAYKCQSDSI